MQWLNLMTAGGQPAMKLDEEVLIACHAGHNPTLRCLFLGRLQRARGRSSVPFGDGLALFSTWDGKPLDSVLVPYAFARPVPPEPRL